MAVDRMFCIHRTLDTHCKTTCCRSQRSSRVEWELYIWWRHWRSLNGGDCYDNCSTLTVSRPSVVDFSVPCPDTVSTRRFDSFQPRKEISEENEFPEIPMRYIIDDSPLVSLFSHRTYPLHHRRHHRHRNHPESFQHCYCQTSFFVAKVFL